MTLNSDVIQDEIADISFVYETLFPDTPVELHFWLETKGPRPPVVLEQSGVYGPEYAALGRLGTVRVGPPQTLDQPGKRVLITLPSPRDVQTRSAQAQPWIESKALFWAIYKSFPILGEKAKYQIEQLRRRRREKKFKFTRLPFAPNAKNGIAGADGRTSSGKTPAILIGVHWFDVGGAESLAIDSIKWALDAGLRVFVMSELEGPERLIPRIPDHPDITLLRTSRYLPRPFMTEFINQLVAQENIVLTHNHHCIPLYDAHPTLKLLHPQVKNIDSTHIIEHADGGYPRVSGVWSNFLDVQHIISDELKQFYNSHFSVYGAKLKLGRLLDPTNRTDEIPAARLTTGQTTCRVAFVGRMVHQKRPIVALGIMRNLMRWGQRNGVTFEFDMVGTGPYLNLVKALLGRWGLQKHLRLHDAGVDVPALLKESDILLLPSSNEGLALVCYEAIEAGCIPISTNVGGQAELCPEETLVDPEPGRAIQQSLKIVKRLLQEAGFAEAVSAAQVEKMNALRAQPTAQEMLGEIYQRAAQSSAPANDEATAADVA